MGCLQGRVKEGGVYKVVGAEVSQRMVFGKETGQNFQNRKLLEQSEILY